MIEISLPMMVKRMMDEGILQRSVNNLLLYVLIYASLNFVGVMVDFLLGYFYSVMKNKVGTRIRLKLMKHLANLSGRYYTDKKTGEVLSVIQSDIDNIESIDAKLFFSIIKNICTALLSMCFMIAMRMELFVMILIAQLVLIMIQKNITKKIHTNISFIRNMYGEMSSIIQEYVLNIMNIVITNSKKYFIHEYIQKAKLQIKSYIKTDLLFTGNISLTWMLGNAVNIMLYGYGGYLIIKGRMTMGTLLAFQGYSSMLIGPCMSIVNSNNMIQQARVSIDRVYALMDEKSDIPINSKSNLLDGKIDSIKFEKVGFGYSKSEDKSLKIHNLDLLFDKNKIYSIVGNSGSGKSTIINLLYRLWDVDEGKILINEEDIRDINLMQLRKKISILTQECLILNASIRDNICLGRKVSEKRFIDICSRLGILEIAELQENGFDTIIGEHGMKISGGQKQRIALARALMGDSDVLVLDEATSALDNISQSKIVNSMKPYLEGKIVIIIAHRLSTIKDVDKIYVMGNGKVVEEGRHEDLINNKGVYNSLYSVE